MALDGRTATLDVNNRLLQCRRPLLQILPVRPPAWSVVPRSLHDSGPGDRYGVSQLLRSRATWRAFEVSSDTLDERQLARVRAAALQILTEAFRLDG